MIEIGSFEAKTHFSDVLRRVQGGEEFVVTMRGRPVAKISHIEENVEADKVEQMLAQLDDFRAQIAAKGPILEKGESFKDLAREGLKW